MILFFKTNSDRIVALSSKNGVSSDFIPRLVWLFGNAEFLNINEISGTFIGPRKEMITPWSTNAVEITQNMGVPGIDRIEEFIPSQLDHPNYDPMLQRIYTNLNQSIFSISHLPEPILFIDDIAAYNKSEGLALSNEEIVYLKSVSSKLGRKLTDSEIFGFSQVNSEHCRHKIFNGQFIIDNKEMPDSLFQLIKRTTNTHPNRVVSAYKDNCAFIQGPFIDHFAPLRQEGPDFFQNRRFESVISLKAETHNFPTTVEPFNGAATGTGGEIRDRIAGGKGAFPIAGTAVYMTAYPRTEENRSWEKNYPSRKWLYQTPEEILIKASNGASDFGNKFGQPLICGSLLTFEHTENQRNLGFDKVIMLAGGVGFGKKIDSLKDKPNPGDKVVLLGGDNYRIGMGGGAVSSVATGEYGNSIELNAVQRSNPEMQKRAYNAIRALCEAETNPIVSIHDHGAGGHLNCLSELVEEEGGTIFIDKLPLGDPTLSAREIAGNESQERMGLVMKDKDLSLLNKIADRERSPFYVVGDITGNQHFTFQSNKTGDKPIDLSLEDFFGNPPKTVLIDSHVHIPYKEIHYNQDDILETLKQVLQLESVACKDWLTNKVDRSVTGRVAKQQTSGEIQLPLNDVAVVSLDYHGVKGIATSIGHAPVAGLVDAQAGSVLSIAEALTNIIWAPIVNGLEGISLSANWMWPCKNEGEDARLYDAVQAASDFTIQLGINIPTGKDSLSMTQKYPDGKVVLAPGTVIVSAVGEVTDIKKTIESVLVNDTETTIYYIDLSNDQFKLGGSSFAQIKNELGKEVPTVKDAQYFKKAFNVVQQLIHENRIMAGHDISAGGLIVTLLEMNFGNATGGMQLDLSALPSKDLTALLFNENPGLIIQVKNAKEVEKIFSANQVKYCAIGQPCNERTLNVTFHDSKLKFAIDELRNTWFKSSYLLDRKQAGDELALKRFVNYSKHKLSFNFPKTFTGKFKDYDLNPLRETGNGPKAAIIREKGVNGDREMAWMLHLAGFDVKDVHMTDLINGRETLENIQFIVFVGGFSNSDVLGSAKGWAGAFLYNQAAKRALDNFYAREDTLSLGVCNGCQLMVELGLINTQQPKKTQMKFNDSHKFESAFLSVDVNDNQSVMLKSLTGARLGIWVAHGEGKFHLPLEESAYNIPIKYTYEEYPGNPNGSDYNAAAICSINGRHLAIMPHLERAIYPWNWAYYPAERKNDEVSPWVEAFVNARKWVLKAKG